MHSTEEHKNGWGWQVDIKSYQYLYILCQFVYSTTYSVKMSLETLPHAVCTHITQLLHDIQLTSEVFSLLSCLKQTPQTLASVLHNVSWLKKTSSLQDLLDLMILFSFYVHGEASFCILDFEHCFSGLKPNSHIQFAIFLRVTNGKYMTFFFLSK